MVFNYNYNRINRLTFKQLNSGANNSIKRKTVSLLTKPKNTNSRSKRNRHLSRKCTLK